MAFDGGFGLGVRQHELPVFGGAVGVIPSPRSILPRQKLTLSIEFDMVIRHRERVNADIETKIQIPCHLLIDLKSVIRSPMFVDASIISAVRKTEKILLDINARVIKKMLFTLDDITRNTHSIEGDVGKVFEAYNTYQMYNMSKIVKALNS